MFDFKTLRQIRRMNDITLEQLADKIGMYAPNIQKLERGQKDGVTFRTVEKIANALGYDVTLQPINPIHLPSQGTTETNKEEVIG